MTTPTQLIVCLFEGDTQADTARQAIQQLAQANHDLKLANIAVVRKDATGKISLYETRDANHNKLISQSPIESVDAAIEMGMMESTGPFGFALYALIDEIVALVTGAVAKIVDFGFPDSTLREIGAGLEDGKSALITLVRQKDAALVTDELSKQGGIPIQQTVATEIIEKLGAKKV
jgi:uncharacterized membrane protein